MAIITKVIDPVTRLEGHLKVTVNIDTVNGQMQVVDAWSSGTLFRGLENVLIGRHPWDAQQITQRMCGVCPVPHSMASVLALQQAAGVEPPPNATILRNLVLAANFLDSHIIHFYHLSAMDYIDGPAMPPWHPSWSSDKRIDATTTAALVANYVAAIDIRRKAHEMCALFGGRMPHPPAFMPGGITTTPRPERLTQFRSLFAEVASFINNVYLGDVQKLASVYNDYYNIGAGPGNLLSFGVFGTGARGDVDPLFKRGQVLNGASTASDVNTRAISEHVKYSWYDDSTTNLKPSAGMTTPVDPATKNTPNPVTNIAPYSWSKAPRYNGRPFECGPLARMWINGDYTNGISVMDRHMARVQEAVKLAAAMPSWLDQIDSAGAVHTDNTVRDTAAAEGLTEAPRGAIGHWLRIEKSRIANYQVITPSCWT